MVDEVAWLLVLVGLQFLTVLVPSAWFPGEHRGLRQWVTTLTGLQALAALAWLVASCSGMLALADPLVISGVCSFQYTPVLGLMFLLISFIGWVTCRYSIRYLDGEARQGRYFQWMGFTIGAVGAMVLSADLLTFGLLWCLTSFGLHHLLLHYADRAAARRAAWTKFIVSRIGDACVLTAVCLYYPLVNSLQFVDLSAAAVDPVLASQPAFQLGTLVLAVGVLAKSAQLPFHTWLPLTMETPTPVSALMHAGIVNAGGFLLVRSAPLLNSSALAQALLLVIGTATACLASVIMLTQTSIKKKLAYSTISQMGFMVMQCGLGAYSAAMLHILAHSLYKAHEFLSSGSVMTRRAAMQTSPMTQRTVSWPVVGLTMLCLVSMAWATLFAVGSEPQTKPGGWLLTVVLSSSLTYWLVQVMSAAQWRLAARAWITAVMLVAAYAISFAWIDTIVSPPFLAVSHSSVTLGLIGLAFLGLFIFQMAIASPQASSRLRNWQIHASNGFYIESWLRRGFTSLLS